MESWSESFARWPGLHRVPDVGRLVVRDHHPLRRETKGGLHDVRARCRGAVRRRDRPDVPRLPGRDVDAVVAAPDTVPVQHEAELPLDVRRGHGTRLQLLLAEAVQRRPPGGQAGLLVLAGEEPLVPPGRHEGLEQRLLGHHVAAGVALVELGDGSMESGPVDDRVMGRQRHPQQVRELVLEGTGQVVVDGVEREHQRLPVPSTGRRRRHGGLLEAGHPLQG